MFKGALYVIIKAACCGVTQRSRGPLDLHLRVAGRRAALVYPVRLRGVLRSEEGGDEVQLFGCSYDLLLFGFSIFTTVREKKRKTERNKEGQIFE